MFNRFIKTIHNKYSVFFRFIFFLRYLFAIFFISLTVFLLIPKFFDYEKKAKIFKNHLLKNYSLKMNKYEEINFYIFPKPRIEIRNVESELYKISSKLLIDKLIFYPKIFSIYNYENFETKKLILSKSKTRIEPSELIDFLNDVLRQRNNLSFKNLIIEIHEKDNFIINLSDISFSNYGYNKKKFLGKIFDKKFIFEIKRDLSTFVFKIPNINFKANLNLQNSKANSYEGNGKLKIFNSNFKFDFSYKDKKFEIIESYFRNKHLSLLNKSVITLDPYFYINSNVIINDINFKILKKIKYNKFLNYKNIINKINSKNEIKFKSQKFNNALIDEITLKIDLAHGRLNYKKITKISDNFFDCVGAINLLDESSILNFDCTLSSKDKRKFLKIFSINYKNKNENLELKVTGYANMKNSKIYFKKVSTNSYEASKEDLKYFNKQFENILFNKNFFDIFELKKIRNFILEIS